MAVKNGQLQTYLGDVSRGIAYAGFPRALRRRWCPLPDDARTLEKDYRQRIVLDNSPANNALSRERMYPVTGSAALPRLISPEGEARCAPIKKLEHDRDRWMCNIIGYHFARGDADTPVAAVVITSTVPCEITSTNQWLDPGRRIISALREERIE